MDPRDRLDVHANELLKAAIELQGRPAPEDEESIGRCASISLEMNDRVAVVSVAVEGLGPIGDVLAQIMVQRFEVMLDALNTSPDELGSVD